jgi:hypothetical protein
MGFAAMELEKHPPEEHLEEYSRGTLSDEEAERLEEHLLVCAACQDRLAELDAFVDATRQAARQVQAEPPSALEDGLRGLSRLAGKPPALVMLGAGLLIAVTLTPRLWHSGVAAEVFPVRLEAVRGPGPLAARAPASRPLALTLDLAGVSGSPTYRVEIVDARGAPAFERTVPGNGGDTVNVAGVRLPVGRYWVRVYEPSGGLLREYGITAD